MKRILFSGILAIGFAFPTNAQNVNIPDVNFKTALLNHNPVIDTNQDGEIQESEAQAFTGTMNVSYNNITNLTGIEAFISLTELNCNNNQLTSLNISNNTALMKLYCGSNQLTNLDISNNTDLITLWSSNNPLTNLDVSNNTALTYLSCYNNQLISLDVSNNTALTGLYCYNNQLLSLDVSNNTALTDLYCDNNQLISLDVSNNTALKWFSCQDNQLTSLDVSNNIALSNLECSNNQLTSLDISNNTALYNLRCKNNQLTSLNVANGNNMNFWFLVAYNNPNLTCIQVDDEMYSNTNWTDIQFFYKPAGAIWSEECTTASVNVVEQSTVSVYPNPVKDILYFEQEIQKVAITNLTGKVLSVQNNSSQINMSNFQNGVYLITIEQENGWRETKKIIKQ